MQKGGRGTAKALPGDWISASVLLFSFTSTSPPQDSFIGSKNRTENEKQT